MVEIDVELAPCAKPLTGGPDEKGEALKELAGAVKNDDDSTALVEAAKNADGDGAAVTAATGTHTTTIANECESWC